MAVEIVSFHHFSLLTHDADRSAEFYEGVLGLRRKTRPNFSTKGLWYEVAGQELHIIESVDVPLPNEGHPAIEVKDIVAAVDACREAGATIQEGPFLRTHDNSQSAFVRDPDGNLLEFTQH